MATYPSQSHCRTLSFRSRSIVEGYPTIHHEHVFLPTRGSCPNGLQGMADPALLKHGQSPSASLLLSLAFGLTYRSPAAHPLYLATSQLHLRSRPSVPTHYSILCDLRLSTNCQTSASALEKRGLTLTMDTSSVEVMDCTVFSGENRSI